MPRAKSPAQLRKALSRAEARRQWRAFGLTLPLLVFLLLTLLVPIVALLQRAVENPEVANALPQTIRALDGWNGHDAPSAAAYGALGKDLAHLPDSADAGQLARRLNTEVAGARSLVMGAYRALPFEGSDADVQARPAAGRSALGRSPVLAGDCQERLALDA